MKWFRRRRKPTGRVESEEIGELLDSYSERATVYESDGSQAVFVPGKVIDNLRDRMERVILDPLVEIAIDDFISQEEAGVMFGSGLGPALIEATAGHGALLARRSCQEAWQPPHPSRVRPRHPLRAPRTQSRDATGRTRNV
jgi:hypothetical protein